jgi:hypothetical protein
MRPWAVGLVGVALLAPAGLRAEPARAPRSAAGPPAAPLADSACFDQHELGQELRQAGKLLESRSSFLECALSECPAAVRRDCERWSTEVSEQLPSVMFRVTLDGRPRTDARVLVDGKLHLEAPREPLSLDPGGHAVRVSLDGASPFQSRIELRAGERARRVEVELHAAGAERERPIPTLSWVLGGVGVAGAGSFIGFGLASRSLEQDLDRRCAPACSDAEIDRVRQRSLVANISLGVGLASLVSAGALYFLSPGDEPVETEPPPIQLSLVPLGSDGALWNVQLRAF